MARRKKPCCWTLRAGLWQYKLDGGKWHSTGCREREDAEQYVREHYAIESQPPAHRLENKPNLTLATFLQPYYGPQCPYIFYRQSKDQRAIRRFSHTHIVRARARIEKYILKDSIATLRLADITSADVEAFQLRLVRAGKGPRMVNLIVGVLKTCLSDGVRRGLYERKITVANIRYDERRTGCYTSEQLQVMFTEIPGPFKDRQAQTFFLLLATSGCRRGEALGLKWGALDLDTGKMQIVAAMREGKELSHPKWGKNREDVQLPDLTVQRLRDYRRECLHVLPDAFVFCHPTGEPYSGGWVTENFQYMQAQTGYRVDAHGDRLTVHGYRHTYTTIGQQQGLTADAMQAIVGWSNKDVAARYSHLRAGDYAQVKNIWGQILK